nr:AsmA-like C-terminal region-containing protein [Salipiger pentaromativorans]
MLAVSAAAGGWALIGRPLSAPDWLRAKVEARIGAAVPGLDIRFGDLRLLVKPDGLASLVLVDVDIRSATGAQVATLSDVEAGFSPVQLLAGEVELRAARLSGAVLTLRRDAQGRLGLALGDVFAADTPAPDIPTLIAQVDAAMTDPRLAGLRVVRADALTIRYEDARARRGWTADGGRLSLTREDGALRLAGDVALLGRGDVAATLALNAESPIGETGVQFGLNLTGLDAQDIATQSPALAWLETLRAPISGALRGAATEDGQLGALSATLQIGAGVLQPNAQTKPIPFDRARTYFSYDPASATLRFDEISVQSSLGTVVSDGRAVLRAAESGWPRGMTGQFRVTRFEADPEGILDSPLQLAGAELDWQLDFDPFRLVLGRFRSTDPALPLRLSGTLAAEREGWRLALDGRLDEIGHEALLAYWPEAVVANTRRWVAENIHAGHLRDAIFALRLAPGGKVQPYIDARLDGVELTYARALPRLTGAAGQLTIYDNRLAMTLEAGQVTPPEGGVLEGAGTRYVIPDLRARPATGELSLSASGPLVAALSYLDSPTLEVMRKAGQPVRLGEGRVALTGRIVLPLMPGVKREDMSVQAQGTLFDVSSDVIVPGKTLRAERLALDLDDTRLEISGSADLSGVPFTGRWTQPMAPDAGSRVEGEIALSEPVVQALGIGLPAGTFSGRGSGRVTIALDKGAAPRFSLSSSLAGLGVALPQIGWSLSQRGTGSLELAGRLGQPLEIDRLALSAAGLEARGAVTLNRDGSFARLDLPELKVGRWLDGAAVLTGRGRGAPPAIALTGGRLDMRSAPFGDAGGGGTEGGPLSVTLDRLEVSDSIHLTAFRGDFGASGGLSGDFTARVGGTAAITGRIVPQHGRSAIRIQSRDAGDVLAGAGIFRSVQDGTFDLTLTPVRGRAGEYDGALEIGGARLQDAPAITGLLDAVSVVGLLDELNGAGIFFSQVEARFRLTPTQVVLTRSSAVGPSMGISMDGYYNLASRTMDMQGVLSPIYILNGIGRLFARKGEGLIGFNFNLSGGVDAPRVSVNPLSVFTPGMFRDIFRRPPPSVSQ